ncbi:hypothetical protein Y032_0299g1775 [Ancylostoma ceylanicum]|uniref:Uncharacterized protein n=1 Tax=Ancylostoma ceylanicum TaxID=53326 RepID=A0A016S3Y0_9BILA|nr:hypothetical protein Y032_0299g1775 [Ancylostoma ceylanicum]
MELVLFIVTFALLGIQNNGAAGSETDRTNSITSNTEESPHNSTERTSLPTIDDEGFDSEFHWRTPNSMLHGRQYVPTELPYVVIKIRDAECYSSFTESSFVIYLAALDFHNKYLSEVHVRSDNFEYNPYTATRTCKEEEQNTAVMKLQQTPRTQHPNTKSILALEGREPSLGHRYTLPVAATNTEKISNFGNPQCPCREKDDSKWLHLGELIESLKLLPSGRILVYYGPSSTNVNNRKATTQSFPKRIHSPRFLCFKDFARERVSLCGSSDNTSKLTAGQPGKVVQTAYLASKYYT